ncbi:MAG TPA: serine hydrolase [Candidatus Eisenbacteria bacterium]|nr:serine hydrolase [Candidatus Eisenbacteria bacterium]
MALLLETPAAALAVEALPAGATGGARAGTSALAAATPSVKQTKPPTRRRRSRRRSVQTLRLPAVTPYGIPRLHVKAAYVVDEATGRVLFQKNPERILPIASLTKLVTAMVLLDTEPDWDRTVEVLPEDVKNSSRSRIRPREEITVRDLIHASIMSSDNVATKALARTCGLTHDEFVSRMNQKAESLGLTGTHFVEPTGLSEQNVATAEGVARLLNAAAANPIVSAIMQKPSYSFASNRKVHNLVNTNRLLHSNLRITGGKTGFINEAGYCLVTKVESPTGAAVTAVVLGAPSNALRFAEARRILDWTFRFGLNRPELGADGESE